MKSRLRILLVVVSGLILLLLLVVWSCAPRPVCQVDPVSLDFGTVTVGDSLDLTFSISNTGGGTLSGRVSEACDDYSLVGDSIYSLTAGQSKTFTVRFKPTSAGVKNCTVETGHGACVVSCIGTGEEAPICRVDPGRLGFGTVRVGDSFDLTFSISNTGGGTLSSTVSEACADYSLVGDSTYSLAAGQSKTFTVRFKPTSAGVKSCTVETGDGSCADVSCTGMGQEAPACQVDPESLDFGTVRVGDFVDLTFGISNTGGGTLSGTVSAACDDYDLVGDSTYSLTGGQSKTFTVRFKPISAGVKKCTIETGNGACMDVSCTGTGQEVPVCRVDPSSLDFGTVRVGVSLDRMFSISNSGGGTLSGRVSEKCDDYDLVGDSTYSLTGGQSKTLTVIFKPTSPGAKNCTIETGNGACMDVSCTGTGQEVPEEWAPAKKEFEKEDWDDAAVELQKLIFNFPGAAIIDSAQYLLGMAYFNEEEYPLAILEFNKLLASYPSSKLSDDAALMVARSDLEMSPKAELGQENTQRAVHELRNFLDDYPQSDRKEEARELLNRARGKLAKKTYKNGYLYCRLGRYESALLYLEKVLNDYHDTDWVKDAQFQIAEVHYKEKKYGQAKEEYEKFLQDFPDHKLAKKAKKRVKKIESEFAPKE